ncbi:MAG: hypothetical protein ACLQVD_12315 [Capsulimonadaceae bacterium]
MNDRKSLPAQRQSTNRKDRAPFYHPYNLLGLAVVVAASAATLSLWILVAGLVIEAVYLVVSSTMGLRSTSNIAVPGAHAGEKGRPTANATPRAFSAAGSSAKSPADMCCERLERLEAAYRLVGLQMDSRYPHSSDILNHLELLMDRYSFFDEKLDLFGDRLQVIAREARTMSSEHPVAPGVVELQLVYSLGDRHESGSIEERVELFMKQAHDGFERELREVAWQRDRTRDGVRLHALDQRAQAVLQRNRQVDKIGKTILNLHYEMQLLDKKFDLLSHELGSRRPEQVLADVRALVLQAQSLTRTVEELEPLTESVEYAAA